MGFDVSRHRDRSPSPTGGNSASRAGSNSGSPAGGNSGLAGSGAVGELEGIAAAPVVEAFEHVVRYCAGLDGSSGSVSGEAPRPGEVITVIEAVETVKAWLDSVQVRAIRAAAAIHTDAVANSVLGDPDRAVAVTGLSRQQLARFSISLARNSLILDVLMATGLTAYDTAKRVRFAHDTTAGTRHLTTALETGTASLPRVLKVHEVTELRAPEVADAIAAKVLAPTRDGARPSARLVSDRLSRLAATHPIEDPQGRLEEALTSRDAWVKTRPDGSAAFGATADLTTATAAATRVDYLARAVRAAGFAHGRTLAQLRSDVTFDLLLHGWVHPTTAHHTAAHHTAAPQHPSATTQNPPTEPMAPVHPADPADPMGPVHPVDPVDSVDPADRVASVDPTDRVHAVDPGDSVDSVDSADRMGPLGWMDSVGSADSVTAFARFAASFWQAQETRAAEERDGMPGSGITSEGRYAWVTPTDETALWIGHAFHATHTHRPTPTPTATPTPTPTPTQHAGPGGTPTWFRHVGQPPPAHVTVTVPLTTLLGIDNTPGRAPGHGWLDAARVRDIATRAGSIWRRLVTDPITGTALDLSTTTYRPTQHIRRHVIARDVTCRAPGCTKPADTCDLDHQTPWPTGPTTPGNLNAKDRAHHHLKTYTIWQCQPENHTPTTTHTTTDNPDNHDNPASHDTRDPHSQNGSIGDPDSGNGVDPDPGTHRATDPRTGNGRDTDAESDAGVADIDSHSGTDPGTSNGSGTSRDPDNASCADVADGGLRWTSPTGRTYTTYPHDYREH